MAELILPADLFQVMPPLSPDEYAELKADISARGVMVPIENDEDGNILDGHNDLVFMLEKHDEDDATLVMESRLTIDNLDEILNAMDIDEAINKILTCRADLHCKREEACFAIAMWARDMRAAQKTAKALEPDDPDMVADYSPDFEAVGWYV